MNMNFDIIVNSKNTKSKINDMKVIDCNDEDESLNYIKNIQDNIYKFTETITERKINIQDKKFRIISERIFEDCITIYLYANNTYIQRCFFVVEKLNQFYKRLYLDTTSPIVRLYQGKFSGLFDLYNIKVKQNKFDNIITSDMYVEKIIWTALYKGSCRIDNDLNEITMNNLNWLALNDLIFITNVNGHSIKISNKCEQIMLSNRKKYFKAYLMYLKKIEDVLVVPSYTFFTSKKKRIISGKDRFLMIDLLQEEYDEY